MAGYYALLGRGPSLGEIAKASGFTRTQRDERERQRQEEERLGRLDDLEMRKQESYEDKFRYDQEQLRLKKEQEATEARRVKTATVRQKISELEPTRQEAARAYADNLARAGTIDQIDWSNQDVATPIESAMYGVEVPKPEAGPTDEIAKAVILGQGIPPNDPRFPGAYTAEQRRQEALGINRARAGASSVVVGPQGPAVGLTTGQQGAVQGDVMAADKSIAQLGRMREAIANAGGARELASMWERGKATVGSVALATPLAGSVDKEKLRNRRAAEAHIATFRNIIYNKLSGAAVSDSERERLMQSVPDVGDPDIEAKMDVWEQNLEYERQYGIDALINGIRAGGIGAKGAGAKTKPPGEAVSNQTAGGDDYENFFYGGQ